MASTPNALAGTNYEELIDEALWTRVTLIVETSLTNLDRIYLEEAVKWTKENDIDSWRQAWRSALNPPSLEAKENLDVMHESIWVPILEGEVGAVAIWGAVVGTTVHETVSPSDIEIITSPWESWARTSRNIFGDGGI